MDVFVRLAYTEYIFYVSLQSFMTCGRSVLKKIIIHLLLYYLFQSLLNHLQPNSLALRLLSTQYLAPQFLSPQLSIPNCSLPLIIFSLIALSP